jgi:hypothetical protein
MASSGIGGEDIGKVEITKKLGNNTTGAEVGYGSIKRPVTPAEDVWGLMLEDNTNYLLENLDFIILESSV